MKEEKEEGSGEKEKRIPFHCLWYYFYLGEGMLLSTTMTKHLKIGKMAFKPSYEFSYNFKVISVLIAAAAASTPPLCP